MLFLQLLFCYFASLVKKEIYCTLVHVLCFDALIILFFCFKSQKFCCFLIKSLKKSTILSVLLFLKTLKFKGPKNAVPGPIFWKYVLHSYNSWWSHDIVTSLIVLNKFELESAHCMN